jgi:hypothetical protein
MPRKPEDDADSDDDFRRRPTPVEGVESDPLWRELVESRKEIRRLEERLRQLENFRATILGSEGAPGVLIRIERGVDGLRGDVENDLQAFKAEQEKHARKLESHDHVFAKVLIAATSGGAVVGVLVNLLFKLLNP